MRKSFIILIALFILILAGNSYALNTLNYGSNMTLANETNNSLVAYFNGTSCFDNAGRPHWNATSNGSEDGVGYFVYNYSCAGFNDLKYAMIYAQNGVTAVLTTPNVPSTVSVDVRYKFTYNSTGAGFVFQGGGNITGLPHLSIRFSGNGTEIVNTTDYIPNDETWYNMSLQHNFSNAITITVVWDIGFLNRNDFNVTFDYFRVTSDVCNVGWYCDGGSEVYQNSSCDAVINNTCSACGCSGGRCVSGSSNWTCHNSFESWHYNETCQNDLQLLCDISCDNVTGQCAGESICLDDSDCSNYCSGTIRYFDPYCNLGSYTCAWHSSQNCTYGCNPYTQNCFPNPPPEPLFGDEDVTTMTPTGFMTTIYNGVMGFVNAMGGSYFILMFMLMAVIVVTLVISIVLHYVKENVK
jgi:hypothetical protein